MIMRRAGGILLGAALLVVPTLGQDTPQEPAKPGSGQPESTASSSAETGASQEVPKLPDQSGAPLSADAIMARVAENQDRSQALRKEYVYRQHTHLMTRKPKGRLMREETADYDMVPGTEGTEKTLKVLSGRYWNKTKYEVFEGEPAPARGGLDGQLIEGIRDDLTNDKSKDGLGKDLFPLTSEEQKKYEFKLAGQETEGGRSVYHIQFRPKDHHEIAWAGDAYIDTTEFQPVRIFTKLSRRLPFAVRTLLGTDVPGIGFNVVYKRQEEGVWFPASFGTEFRLHAVFFLNRDITIALENSNFERTHVQSKMRVVGPADDDKESH